MVSSDSCPPDSSTPRQSRLTLAPLSPFLVTWDASFFKGNTTVQLTGSSFNTTTGEILDQAFPPTEINAGWSFYAWTVDRAILSAKSASAVNISLTIAALQTGSEAMTPYQGPRLLVTEKPVYHQPKSKPPTGLALYIGLPTVLGFVVLLLVGTYLWNRKTRRIDVGNIMGRGRGGYGVGKNRRQRIREQGIRITDQDVGPRGAGGEGAAAQHYRDDVPAPEDRAARGETGWRQEVPGRHDDFDFDMPRRDSDALGSLAGTPTEDRRMELGRGERGNAFRDEVSRQDHERL
jgi:hypothetical protein